MILPREVGLIEDFVGIDTSYPRAYAGGELCRVVMGLHPSTSSRKLCEPCKRCRNLGLSGSVSITSFNETS